MPQNSAQSGHVDAAHSTLCMLPNNILQTNIQSGSKMQCVGSCKCTCIIQSPTSSCSAVSAADLVGGTWICTSSASCRHAIADAWPSLAWGSWVCCPHAAAGSSGVWSSVSAAPYCAATASSTTTTSSSSSCGGNGCPSSKRCSSCCRWLD